MHVQLRVTGERRGVTRDIGEQYGSTPEIALEMLTLALVRAERPLLMDARGELLEFAPGSVSKIMVWEKR